jgi:hypothetical protein
MREGEVDITSPGIANVYTTRRGTLELRGGTTSIQLQAENLKIRSRAPLHTKECLGHQRQKLGDEERFGVVTRPGALTVKLADQPTLEDIVFTTPNNFAKEYVRILRSDGPKADVVMIDHREGDVYDDAGDPIKDPHTSKKLRSQTKFGTTTPGVSTTVTVDEEGNVQLTIPKTAKKGLSVDLEGDGSIELTIGKDLIANITKNLIFHIQETILLEAEKNIDVKTKKVFSLLADSKAVFDSPKVEVGKGADTPGVRGQDLMNWLTTHTHPTGTGPSGAPITPPPQSILSTVVKLK